MGTSAATTGTITRVSASASTGQLLAANGSRQGCVIYNDSTATLYLKYGTTATTTSFTYLIGPGVAWEMPGDMTYNGRIDGIWTAANGAAEITELT